MLTTNKELRQLMRAKQIPIWKLADKLNISENTCQRMLRKELEGEDLNRVQTAIDAIQKEGAANG